MSDQHGRRGDSLYYCGNTTGLPDSLFVERIWARLERQAEAEMDPHEIKVLPKQTTRQINYRRRREASLARDTPPRLPCRPFQENGPLTAYDIRNLDQTIQYHQKRIDDITPRSKTLDNCYTCVNHRLCDQHLCKATRLTCFYCESEEGPLKIREQTRMKREQDKQRARTQNNS